MPKRTLTAWNKRVVDARQMPAVSLLYEFDLTPLGLLPAIRLSGGFRAVAH